MPGKFRYSQRVVDQAHALAKQGKTLVQISNKLGIPRQTISGWVGKNKTKYVAERPLEIIKGKPVEKPKPMLRIHVPDGAEAYHFGVFYKRGLRGKVFWWDSDCWKLSTTDASSISWGRRIV